MTQRISCGWFIWLGKQNKQTVLCCNSMWNIRILLRYPFKELKTISYYEKLAWQQENAGKKNFYVHFIDSLFIISFTHLWKKSFNNNKQTIYADSKQFLIKFFSIFAGLYFQLSFIYFRLSLNSRKCDIWVF